jgi:hypothetical protein
MQRRRELVALSYLTLAAFLGGAALGFVRPEVLDGLRPLSLPGVVPAAPLETIPIAPAQPAQPAQPAKPERAPHPVTMLT